MIFLTIILFAVVVLMKYSYYRDIERNARQAAQHQAPSLTLEHTGPHRGWWNRVLKG